MASHLEVIKRFAEGGRRIASPSVYYTDNILYSYGTHFPLALKSNWGAGVNYLINGDRYSHTTSRHQSLAIRQLKDNVQVPFSALNGAGIYPQNIVPKIGYLPKGRTLKIVAHTSDKWWETCAKCGKTVDYLTSSPYGISIRHEDGTEQCEGATRNYHHVLGSVVLKYREPHKPSRYFLSSIDPQETTHRHYFLTELPHRADTVEAAYEALKPMAVKRAEARGTEVRRQGDIFAIKTGFTAKDLQAPDTIKKRNAAVYNTRHIVTDVRECFNGVYGRGSIKHNSSITQRNRWGSRTTPEHKRVTLGKTWWLIVRNTAKGGWSARGNVD